MNHKIAHLLISMSVGGAEQLALKMMKAAPQRSLCFCLDTDGPLADQVRKLNIPVLSFGRKPGWDFSVSKQIADASRQNNVQILHCHQYSPWFYGVLSRIINPAVKIIYTEHGRPYPDTPKLLRRIFNPICSYLTHSITSVSPFISEALQKIEWFPKHKITTIFNGIEKSFSEVPLSKSQLRKKLDLDDNLTYIILPARFNPIKWHTGLIDAFKQVHEEYPQARLILLGDGQEKQRLVNQISKLNLSEHILMPGVQNNVHEWMAASDIFVLSSLSEGTSISLLEAMALGVPAVVTDAGGNRFIIKENVTALLAKHSDADDLAKKLLTLCNAPEIRKQFGIAAREHFINQFTLEKMLFRYEQLYLKML